jgi:hypothetical protein
MSPKKFGLAAAAIAAAGAVALGGSALANAAGSTGTNVSGYAATAAPTSSGSADGSGQDGSGQNGTGTGGRGPAAHGHTEVTGDEAAKVSAAVTAKDAGVTVAKVLKDPDGSYDVLGTKAGQPVHFEVSADLATVTEGRGPGGRGQGPAAHAHTEVTGDEAAKVSAAVTAKDAGVTVAKVRKDPDGSYDVLGTKAGQPVHFEVSSDLATVTEGRGPGGRGQGPAAHAHTEVTGDEAAKVSAAVTAKDAGVTVAKVRKDPDGSYDVLGTKAGQPVHFEVSSDLATVSQGGPGADGRRPGGPGGKGRPGGATSSAPTTSAPAATS